MSERDVAATLAERLEGWIVDNLDPGSELPSEKELAETYGVSRLTIREAMKHLTGRGLIETGQGRRAHVTRRQGSSFLTFLNYATAREPTSVLDLADVRIALEVQSAAMAAVRANRAGIAAIESCLDAMRAAAEAAKQAHDDAGRAVVLARYNQADVRFHEALALASGNRILGALLESIEAPLQKSQALSMENQVRNGRASLDEKVAAHGEILDFVRQGEDRKAAAAMRAHLTQTKRELRSVLLSQIRFAPAPPSNPSQAVEASEGWEKRQDASNYADGA